MVIHLKNVKQLVSAISVCMRLLLNKPVMRGKKHQDESRGALLKGGEDDKSMASQNISADTFCPNSNIAANNLKLLFLRRNVLHLWRILQSCGGDFIAAALSSKIFYRGALLLCGN